jgi:site-specific recombinase XerD
MSHDVFSWERRLKKMLKNVKGSKELSIKNKEVILSFYEHCIGEELSKGRVLRYVQDLKTIAERWLRKDFEDVTKKDIKNVLSQILQTKTAKGEPYAEPTKQEFKNSLKKFYWWLRGCKTEGESKIFPEEVSWIDTRIKSNNRKLPEDILTEVEVNRLIESAKNVKERAFISTLYESGCRIKELLSLKIKNIEFDDYGAQLIVSGKTGSRRVRIISSAPFLKEWIDTHPNKKNREAYVWINREGVPMKYKSATIILEGLKKRAGITKRINPHNFRHTRATHLSNVLTDAQMRIHFGWVKSSRMTEIYEHLSGRDVDKRLLEHYGIEYKLNICSQCKETNRAGSKYCQKCGMPLVEETRKESLVEDIERSQVDSILDKIVQNKKTRRQFLNLIKQVINQK